MEGVDITTVKELLGHKTLTMTLRYAHLAPSHKVKAVDVLDRALNGNSTSHLLHSLPSSEVAVMSGSPVISKCPRHDSNMRPAD